jgi:hemoglobin-like flavoprotein
MQLLRVSPFMLLTKQSFFLSRLFVLDPSALDVFTFGKNITLNEEFFKSDHLVRHAKFFIKMIDRSLALLGPDIELLTEILLDLGKQHRQFGVKASHYLSMGQALLSVVEELLGDKFKRCVKDAWLEVYQALSYDMIRGPNAE